MYSKLCPQHKSCTYIIVYICVIVQCVFPAPEISRYQNWRAFWFVYIFIKYLFLFTTEFTKSKKQSKQKPIFRLFLVLQSRWAFKQSEVLHVANCFKYESFLWYCWLRTVLYTYPVLQWDNLQFFNFKSQGYGC